MLPTHAALKEAQQCIWAGVRELEGQGTGRMAGPVLQSCTGYTGAILIEVHHVGRQQGIQF